MVIKDEKGKAVIILSKEDIIEYIGEKCGLEIRLEVESMIKNNENNIDEDEIDSLVEENSSLQDRLYESELENERLRRRVEDLEENCETYKRLAKKEGKNEGTGTKI